MRKMTNLTNDNRPDPGDTPKPPDTLPPGDEPSPGRHAPEPTKQPGRPTPSGAPNESRATDADYRYKYGRQGVGEVPSPAECKAIKAAKTRTR